jgi:hypothetical protein
MAELTDAFKALIKEAQFTKEMLGAGATQIRAANYASKGVYFQAFTSLSTGLERIGKLCLMLDHYIDHQGQFPDLEYLKKKIGHKISLIYERSAAIVAKRSVELEFLQNLDDPIHRAIIKVLSEFAEGDRYSNINLLVGGARHNDPVAAWYKFVDLPLYGSRVSAKKKATIERHARIASDVLSPFAMVLHTSETDDEITTVEEASGRTGMQMAVAPYRQLSVLQIIRYWTELLNSLQYLAMEVKGDDIPFMNEIFAPFYNADSYLRGRKTWDTV